MRRLSHFTFRKLITVNEMFLRQHKRSTFLGEIITAFRETGIHFSCNSISSPLGVTEIQNLKYFLTKKMMC